MAAVAFVFWSTIRSMPDSVSAIENYTQTGHTLIYSADGVELADLFAQNRQNVTIDQIPQNLQNATVAIEDARFWQDNIGFDPRGIARAVWRDIRGGDADQGGSTITQQLVRNLGIDGLTRQKTLIRKVREIIIANQIEKNYSKQQILEMYLNDVYYGSGSYGVQAAAYTYFGKTAKQLDIAQCAMIAGLPQRPTDYSPYVNKQAAFTRRNIVLARMLQLGYITNDQYQSALAEPIVLAFAKPPSGQSRTYHANYFVDYVVQNLIGNYGSDFVYRGGLKVYTTLNLAMQQQAESIVQQNLSSLHYLNVTQAALVCIEPQTGYIKAMVGGANYQDNQFNIAAYGRRQPGSSFKPIYYTAALDSGIITEDTKVDDAPIDLPGANGKPWRPTNDNGLYSGWVTARDAIAMSLNCASIRVLQMVGIGPAIRYARLMGVESPLAPYMTLALGASAVTPLEMADVYATIDNGGARPIISAITKITDDSGQVIEDDAPKLETTGISADACRQMSDMLRAVITSGTASASFHDDNPPDAHGKTGTTQNHLDVWFDGYTKDLVTIVWAGHPAMGSRHGHGTESEPLAPEAWGATVTVPIWKQFMIAAEGIEQQEKAREAAQQAAAAPLIITPPQPSPTPTGGNAAQEAPATQQTPADTDTGNDASALPADTSGGDDSAAADATPVGSDNGADAAPTPALGAGGASPSAPSGSTVTMPDEPSPPAPASAHDSGNGYSTAYAAPTPSSPRMVTVTVCAESGLLATRWCPETIQETFIAGEQPKRYCNLHHAPPGE